MTAYFQLNVLRPDAPDTRISALKSARLGLCSAAATPTERAGWSLAAPSTTATGADAGTDVILVLALADAKLARTVAELMGWPEVDE